MPIWKCEKVCGHYQSCSADRAWVFSLWNRSPLLFVSVFYINNDGSRTRAVLPLYYTPIIFWLPALGCTKAGMCDLRRIAQIIGALPRETAGSFQEVPLNSRITPWVFNKRSNLTFICVRSLHLLRPPPALCSVSDDWIPSQKQNTKENQSCLSILSFDWPGTRAGFLVGRNLLSRWRAETRKPSTTLVASFPVDSIYALNYLATVIET